ncbi:MAG: hypothetical protein QOH35_5414 [Acidobacteriaceae bacterium]|nr:hypothetical protein [Acidobacteriaceae bacterium]
MFIEYQSANDRPAPPVPVEDSVNEAPSPLEPYALAEPPEVMIRTGQKKNDLKPNKTRVTVQNLPRCELTWSLLTARHHPFRRPGCPFWTSFREW